MHPYDVEISENQEELEEKSPGVLTHGMGRQAGRQFLQGRKIKLPHQEAVTPLLLDAKPRSPIQNSLLRTFQQYSTADHALLFFVFPSHLGMGDVKKRTNFDALLIKQLSSFL